MKILSLSLMCLVGCATSSYKAVDNVPVVYNELSHDEAYKSRVKAACNGDMKCAGEAANKEFYARVNKKYFAANAADVTAACGPDSVNCPTPQDLELKAIESHNQGLAAQERASNQAKDAQMGNAGRALSNFGQQLEGPKEQHCVSSPNVLGGYNMSCH